MARQRQGMESKKVTLVVTVRDEKTKRLMLEGFWWGQIRYTYTRGLTWEISRAYFVEAGNKENAEKIIKKLFLLEYEDSKIDTKRLEFYESEDYSRGPYPVIITRVLEEQDHAGC